jgi:hypothetical protein
MADITLVMEVLGEESLRGAATATKRLESGLNLLQKEMATGRVKGHQLQSMLNKLAKEAKVKGRTYQQNLRITSKYNSILTRNAQVLRSVRTETAKNTSSQRVYNSSVREGAQAQNQFGVQANRAQVKTKRFASVGLQQAGYQVGDFAVQIQGGTNAMVALGQQGSQLLGIFGAGGAIAGAGLAIITAFLAPLIRSKKAAEEFSTSASSAISDYESELEKVAETQDLLSKLTKGGLTFQIENAPNLINLLSTELQIRNRLLAVELMRTKVTRERLAESVKTRRSKAREKLAPFMPIDSPESVAGQTLPQGRSFNANQLRNMGVPVPATEGVWQYEAALRAVAMAKADPEFEDFLLTLKEDNVQLDLLDHLLDKNAKGIKDLSNSANEVVGMSDEAERLTLLYDQQISVLKQRQQFGDKHGAVKRQEEFVARQRLKAELESKFINEEIVKSLLAQYDRIVAIKAELDERSEAEIAFQNEIDEMITEETRAREEAERIAQREAERIANALRQLQKKLAVQKAIIGASKEEAMLVQALGVKYKETYGEKTISSLRTTIAKIEELTKAQEQQDAVLKSLESGFSNFFNSLVDGTKSVKDAFKDMARSILADLWEIYVTRQITDFLVGTLDGLLFGKPVPSAKGNVFKGGGIVPFASGGVVSSPTLFPMSGGQTGLMGEAGPEAIMPLKRTSSGELGVVAEGSGTVVVHQNFNFQANGDESVKRIIAQAAPQISKMTQRDIVQARKQGGTMKAVFS